MSKSEELLRLERDLNGQPELREKLEAERKRIAGAGEAQCDGEVLVRAAAALGYTLTLEELERSVAEMQELDPDELDTAAGGKATEAKEKRVACWSDYTCLDLYNALPEKEKST